MLREVTSTGYRPHERQRRWFRSETADLYVWSENGLSTTAFEYCYRDLYKEHRLHWDANSGFRYASIDDGEQSPLRNDTPLVVPNGEYHPELAARHFREQGLGIDGDIYRSILDILYANFPVPENIDTGDKD